MKKYIDKFMLWQLMYRTEIIIFVCGFIIRSNNIMSNRTYDLYIRP